MSDLFFNDLAQYLLVEREIGDQLAQTGVLFFQVLQPAHFRRHQPAVDLLPSKECGPADAELATHLVNRCARLRLLQRERDLLFREPELLHGQGPSQGYLSRKTLTRTGLRNWEEPTLYQRRLRFR